MKLLVQITLMTHAWRSYRVKVWSWYSSRPSYVLQFVRYAIERVVNVFDKLVDHKILGLADGAITDYQTSPALVSTTGATMKRSTNRQVIHPFRVRVQMESTGSNPMRFTFAGY